MLIRLWLIGLLAVLARLAVGLSLGTFWSPEVWEYDVMARSLLAGQGLVFPHLFHVPYVAYAPPLYAWVSAGSYLLSGSLWPLMLLQALAGGLTTSIAGAITTRVFRGAWAPLLTAGFVAVHPGLTVYASMKAHPLTFDALFFTLAVWCTVRLAERLSVWNAVLLGAVVGVGTLSRGTLLVVLAIAGVWLLAVTDAVLQHRLRRRLGVALLVTGVLLGPWAVRNTLHFHRFVWLLSTDAEDFWRGNNPNASGGSYALDGRPVLDHLSAPDVASLAAQPDELAQAAWFRAHAQFSVRLWARKFVQFWTRAATTHYSQMWTSLYLALYGIEVLTALVGLWVIAPRGLTGAPLLLGGVLLSVSLLQSAYYVEGRHRWAVEPLLLVFSGGAVSKRQSC